MATKTIAHSFLLREAGCLILPPVGNIMIKNYNIQCAHLSKTPLQPFASCRCKVRSISHVFGLFLTSSLFSTLLFLCFKPPIFLIFL